MWSIYRLHGMHKDVMGPINFVDHSPHFPLARLLPKTLPLI